jgi:hypothetical protein
MYQKREIIGFHKLSAGRDWPYLDSGSSEGGKEKKKDKVENKDYHATNISRASEYLS